MGKMSFAVTSLVAAIPGGILCYLLVMAFVSHAANLQLMSQIFIGLTLLCAATVALLPIGILIFGGRRAAKKSAVPAGKKSKAAAVSDDEVVLDADDEEEVLDADDDLEATSSFEPVVDEDEDFTEAVEAGSEEMFLESADDIEATSDDVFDAFDEDEPPAKGKKKR